MFTSTPNTQQVSVSKTERSAGDYLLASRAAPRLLGLLAFWCLLGIYVLSSVGCNMMASNCNVSGREMFEQRRDYMGAYNKFLQALRNDPKNADAYYNLAALYHYQGLETKQNQQLQMAESYYNNCLNVDPNHVECYRGLATLLVQTERKDRALALLRNWSVTNPQSADPKVELAKLYRDFGDAETSLQLLADAARTEPNNWRAFRDMGQIREEQGNYAYALQNYQESLRKNSFQPDLATKVASLQRSVVPQPTPVTPIPATQTATAPANPINTFGRY